MAPRLKGNILPTLSAEQVVDIAEEFCAASGAKITNYAALAGIAGMSNPRIFGVPVYITEAEQSRTLRRSILDLHPLDQGNKEFAEVFINVMRGRLSLRWE
ncbi:hypothetical protein GP475_00040 [Corynebacterium poyangense]|uniref:Uncharacterized protein n=1 Tax=Corynebacterium poyangense TaxID=2684405 RepID=A0A7H0SKX2_9CORY|nr:hypothetical protein [Corynebacterium poyangense]MBZ8177287.1 hypothetical protein [Corynebacterium poyangense]QNQ89197.1 hypothetical protein GP475_00040 [Corynebacterium poyangense]